MTNSKNTSLKSALKAHYRHQTLPDDKIDRLLALQNEQMGAQDNRQNDDCTVLQSTPGFARIKVFIATYLKSSIPAYALASFAILVLVMTLIPMPATGPSILTEIAGHHQEPIKITIHSSSLEEIGSQLEKLSFTLIASSKLSSDIWQILGGSYCSINGELAAQLKVRNREENKIYTFYQAEYPTELALNTIKPISTTNTLGTHVSIWKENGLLLGLAKTSQ